MSVKLGIAPIAWSNDDMPELGGDIPIEVCLAESKKAGFSGIELGGKFPRNPGITNYLLNKFQLKMPGGWYGAQLRNRSIDEEWSAMQDHLNLLKIIKGDIFVFADVSGSIQGDGSRSLSSRPTLEKNEWDDYCNKISEISNRLSNEGIPMSYHEHMGTIIQSEEDVEKFIDKTNDKTYLLYDTGHLLFAQANYEKILKYSFKDVGRKRQLRNFLLRDIFFNTLEELSLRFGVNITTVYDIGANKGEWAAEASKYLSGSEFYLFEANSTHIKSLERSGFDFFITAWFLFTKIIGRNSKHYYSL